jgi:hypothetical protein
MLWAAKYAHYNYHICIPTSSAVCNYQVPCKLILIPVSVEICKVVMHFLPASMPKLMDPKEIK